jgi:hypothetical protein
VDDIHENQLATAGDDDSIIRQIDPYTIRLYNKPDYILLQGDVQ